MSYLAHFLLVFGTAFTVLVLWMWIGSHTVGASDPTLDARWKQCSRNHDAAIAAFLAADADRKHLMMHDLADAAEASADIWTELGVHCGPAVYAIACIMTIEAWILRKMTS